MKKSAYAICLLCILYAVPASAAEFTVQPFVTNVTTESIDICFQSDEPVLAVVDYGPTEEYGEQISVAGQQYQANWGDYALLGLIITYETVDRYAHCTTVEGLQPDTQYHYSVDLGTKATPDRVFKTAPLPPESFTFVVYGDSRADPLYPLGVANKFHREVIDRMGDYDFDLFFNLGDLVNDGHDIRLWELSLGISAPVAASIPQYPVYGNHENRGHDGIHGRDIYALLFSLPAEESLSYTDLYYSFNYSNAHFCVISTDMDFEPGSVQDAWIRNDLDQADLNPDITWKFLFFHHPAFTSSFRWPNDDKEHKARDYIVPLAEEYEVDVVFMGHEHSYERSYKDGIYYIVAGNGGALPTFFGDPTHNIYSQFFEPNADFAHFGFCIVDIQEDYLKLQSIIADGSLLDVMEIGDPPEPDDDDDTADDDDDDTEDDDDDDDDDTIPGDDDDDDDAQCCG